MSFDKMENAERFGLAQLHQLRGRVGRGKKQSYCIFINGKESEESMERLRVLENSNDGFFIASEDLKLRGPGDFFGIRQSGDALFELADIYNHADMLQLAQDMLKKYGTTAVPAKGYPWPVPPSFWRGLSSGESISPCRSADVPRHR